MLAEHQEERRLQLENDAPGWTWDQRLLRRLQLGVWAPLRDLLPAALGDRVEALVRALMHPALHSEASGPAPGSVRVMGLALPLYDSQRQSGLAATAMVRCICTVMRMLLLLALAAVPLTPLALLAAVLLRAWRRLRQPRVGYEARDDGRGGVQFDYEAYARKMGVGSGGSRIATLDQLRREREAAVGDESQVSGALSPRAVAEDVASDSSDDEDATGARAKLLERMGLRSRAAAGAGHVLGGGSGRSVLLDKFKSPSAKATETKPAEEAAPAAEDAVTEEQSQEEADLARLMLGGELTAAERAEMDELKRQYKAMYSEPAADRPALDDLRARLQRQRRRPVAAAATGEVDAGSEGTPAPSAVSVEAAEAIVSEPPKVEHADPDGKNVQQAEGDEDAAGHGDK
jgi:hypothetical protein